MKTIRTTQPFQDPQGNAVSRGYLILQLSQPAEITSGGGQVAPIEIRISLDANGEIPANTQIWANDELTPSGTTYTATLKDSGNNRITSFGPWSISGTSPIDLAQMVTTATGASYPSPVLLDSPLAGDLLPDADNTRNLGSAAAGWRAHLSALEFGSSVWLTTPGAGVLDVGTSEGATDGTISAGEVAAGTLQAGGAGVLLYGLSTGVSRFSNGAVAAGNGTPASSSGSFVASNFIGVGATSGTITLTPAAVAGSNTLTLPAATDTLVAKATTDTLTNKTYDTAGTGNVLKINGNQVSAVTGSGNTVALATNPTLAGAGVTNVLSVTGNSNLGTTAGTGGPTFAGGFTSPQSGRMFIGDGTGWHFSISKRASSTTTDLWDIKDSGDVTLTAAAALAWGSSGIATADTFLTRSASGTVKIGSTSGNNDGTLNFTTFATPTAGGVTWGLDTSLSRTSAGVVAIGTGALGNSAGTIQARNVSITGSSSGTTTVSTDATASGTVTLKAGTYTVVGDSLTQTVTNKRVTQRVVTLSTSTTFTPDGDNSDITFMNMTGVAGTLTIAAPTGTPTDGQKLTLRIKTTNAQTYSFNATYRFSTSVTAPTTTAAGKTDYLICFWNATDSKWDVTGVSQGY